MQKTYSTSTTPSFRRKESYSFSRAADYKIYQELNRISEEIEKCRRRVIF